MLAEPTAWFHNAFPGIELDLLTATRTEGRQRIAQCRSDLHCCGIDAGKPLPEFLRRERFLDMTARIDTWRGHPLFNRAVTDLVRCPWVDFDGGQTRRRAVPDCRSAGCSNRSTRTRTPAYRPLCAGTTGLFLMVTGPYLAWLSLTFLETPPGTRRPSPPD